MIHISFVFYFELWLICQTFRNEKKLKSRMSHQQRSVSRFKACSHKQTKPDAAKNKSALHKDLHK